MTVQGPVRDPEKILIVRLSALGDVVQTLPVLARLRAQYPNAEIGWLVESQASVLLQGHPMLNHLHVSHRKRWTKALFNPGLWLKTLQEMKKFFREIRDKGYDVAIDFQGLLKSAFTTRLTGIRHRVGFAAAREGAPLFYTQKVPIDGSFFAPEVPIRDHFDALLRGAGVSTADSPQYPLAPLLSSDREGVQAYLSQFTAFAPVVVLAPATQWASKHWPVSHWQGLLRDLMAQTAVNVVLIGGPADQALAQQIIDAVPPSEAGGRVLNLAGKTSMPQLAALFEVPRVVVGSDSAPLHLAGAVGVPHIIGLYGPTSPTRTPPPDCGTSTLMTTDEALDCLFCDCSTCPLPVQHCMNGISVKRVLAEVETRLAVSQNGC